MKRNRKGRYTLQTGAVYDGCWEDGDWNGPGTYTHQNENKYEGEWEADFTPNPGGYMKDWSGKKFEVLNDAVFEEEWKDGLPHGQGRLTLIITTKGQKWLLLFLEHNALKILYEKNCEKIHIPC